MGRNRPTWPKARENAERQIQINYYKIQTFIKSHVQDKLKLHCCESSQHVRFQKGFSMLLSENSTSVNKERKVYLNPADATQNAEIKI